MNLNDLVLVTISGPATQVEQNMDQIIMCVHMQNILYNNCSSSLRIFIIISCTLLILNVF